MHDRAEELLSPAACRDVIRSIKDHGQVLPVIGRTVRNIPGIDFELIYGARRLFSAQYLDVNIAVEVVDVDDQEALRLMYIENAHRSDLSPYERGVAFRRWIRDGNFSSQNELAEAIGVSVATVSRLLSFSRLPAAVTSAFADPREIREEWAVQLARKCQDQRTRSLMTNIARSIASDGSDHAPKAVFRRMMRAGSGERKKQARDQVFHDTSKGQVHLRVRETDHNVVFMVPSHLVSKEKLSTLISCVRAIISDRKSNGNGKIETPSGEYVDGQKVQPASYVR